MARKKVASDDLLTRLASQTLVNKLGLLMVFLILVGLMYWQFLYKGLKRDQKAEESTRSGLLTQKRSLNKRADEFKEIQAKEAQLLLEAKGITLALPSEAELPSFIQHLQEKAGEAGVRFMSYGRLKEQPVQDFIKVPMSVEVEGTFYQLLEYFHLLGPKLKEQKNNQDGSPVRPDAPRTADKQKFDRIVSIEDLTLDDIVVRNDEIQLTARFTASTFRKEDPELSDEAKAKAAKAKAAARKRKAPKRKVPAKGAPGVKTPVKGTARPKGKIGAFREELNRNVEKYKDHVADPINKAKKFGQDKK